MRGGEPSGRQVWSGDRGTPWSRTEILGQLSGLTRSSLTSVLLFLHLQNGDDHPPQGGHLCGRTDVGSADLRDMKELWGSKKLGPTTAAGPGRRTPPQRGASPAWKTST